MKNMIFDCSTGQVLRAVVLASALALTACGGGGGGSSSLASSVARELTGHTANGLEAAMDLLIGSRADSVSASQFEAAMDAMATGNS